MLLIIIIILIIISFVFIYYYSKQNENLTDNIIIPDIIGGIGNQLFIVASAFAFAKDHNYKLMLDNRDDVYSYGKSRPTYNTTIFSKLPITNTNPNEFIRVNEYEYASNTNINNNIFLTGGYYQEVNYFDKYREELLDLLDPPIDTVNKINDIFKINNIDINKDFLVAIHIRLDDIYTPIDSDNRVYDKDEYDTIINKLPKHLKYHSNTKFIIFSNDISKTKNIFNNVNIENNRMIYIESEDYIELYLMAKCHDYIVSPSTFNWWGIYLNKNPDKKLFIYWKQNSGYKIDFFKKYEYFKNIIID